MNRKWFLFALGTMIIFASGLMIHLYAEHIHERYRDALPSTSLQPYEFHIFQGLAAFGLIGLGVFSVAGVSLLWEARYEIWEVLNGKKAPLT